MKGKYYSATGDCSTNFNVLYHYDESFYNGLSTTNSIGRRMGLTDAAGSTAWSYDIMGRPLKERRSIGSVTKELTYQYNYDGSPKSLLYPSGALLEFLYDDSEHLLSALDNGNDIRYAEQAVYNAPGSLTSLKMGDSGTFAGYQLEEAFNNRLQPTKIAAKLPSGTYFFDRRYTYGASPQNNGNILLIANNVDTSHDRDISFTYDALNRIASAQSANADCSLVPGTNLTKNWGNSYTIDAWGNLTAKVVTKCGSESLATTVNEKNQLGVGTYDAAGNLMNYSGATYTYDTENRIATTGGITYTYDGDGVRVKKSNGTLYWGESFTDGPIAETDLSGAIKAEYVYFGGKRIARRDFPSGSIHYYFSDHLNSASLVDDQNGILEEESDFYPFGGERSYVIGPNSFKFTGKERDPESELDYFGARYFSNTLARFTSSDWSAKIEPIPYSKLDTPQTLNLYSFVLNNPLSNDDPEGHACVYIYGNSGSGFCTRAAEYGQIDAKPGIRSKTRFFAAANATSQALANVKVPVISALFVSQGTTRFLEGVGQALQKLNQTEAKSIESGPLSGSNLDQQLVHKEQNAVQGQLDSLKQQDPDAYSKTVGEINGVLNSTAAMALDQLAPTDRAYASVLAGVRADLGRDIDFSNQSDREAIGNAVIVHIRKKGGCDVNGKKQPGC